MTASSYIAIDLKSFYASVECIERGLDPLATNLVVADESRSTKTICLAATPSLKAYGIPGRARLFEVVQKTKEANFRRKANAPKHILTGESCDANELAANPSLAMSYIVAKPRMALYMKYSTRIYGIYLKYVAPVNIMSSSISLFLLLVPNSRKQAAKSGQSISVPPVFVLQHPLKFSQPTVPQT